MHLMLGELYLQQDANELFESHSRPHLGSPLHYLDIRALLAAAWNTKWLCAFEAKTLRVAPLGTQVFGSNCKFQPIGKHHLNEVTRVIDENKHLQLPPCLSHSELDSFLSNHAFSACVCIKFVVNLVSERQDPHE